MTAITLDHISNGRMSLGVGGRHRSGAARAEAPLRQVATPRNWLRGRVPNYQHL